MFHFVLHFYQKGVQLYLGFPCRQILDRFDIRVVWSQREHFRAQFGTNITPPSLSVANERQGSWNSGAFSGLIHPHPSPLDQPCPQLYWLPWHEILWKNTIWFHPSPPSTLINHVQHAADCLGMKSKLKSAYLYIDSTLWSKQDVNRFMRKSMIIRRR